MFKLMLVMLGCAAAAVKRTAVRDMSMATWCAMTIGRGDDARLVFLPDLLKPTKLRIIGAGAATGGLQQNMPFFVFTLPLPTYTPPTTRTPHATTGPAACFMLTAVLRGGKRQFGGKIAYRGCIRNKDAVLCAHGALGRQLYMTYTARASPFPDPADKEIWRHTPVWPGNDPTVSISYQQQADSLKVHLEAADIAIGKVCCCVAGSRIFLHYDTRDC
jgi:hypothetical protein